MLKPESPKPSRRAYDGRNSLFTVGPDKARCLGQAPSVRPFLSPAQRAVDMPTIIVLSPNGA